MIPKTQETAPTRVDPKSPEQAAKDAKMLLSSALLTAVVTTSALLLGSALLFG